MHAPAPHYATNIKPASVLTHIQPLHTDIKPAHALTHEHHTDLQWAALHAPAPHHAPRHQASQRAGGRQRGPEAG
eukprot:scaffold305560_cov22-Tisochrysis_lutea.AAC.1